jgi:hypothetical protein
MKNSDHVAWLAGGLMLLPLPATAAILCQADPAVSLAIDSAGNVYTNFVGAGVVNICNMYQNERGITKETCAGWYSGLLSAQSQRTKVTFYIDNAVGPNVGVTSCSTLGNYATRAPYFMISGANQAP